MSLDPDVQAVFGTSAPSSYGDPDVNAVFAEQPQSWGDAAKGVGKMFVGGAESAVKAATGAVGGLGGGLTYLGTLAATGDPGAAKAVQEDTQRALTYEPRTAEGKANAAALNDVLSYVGKAGESAGSNISELASSFGASPEVAGFLGASANTGVQAIPYVLALRKGMAEEVPLKSAQQIVDEAAANSPQSMGAAAAAPDLESASPALQQAVVTAARKNAGAINPDALANHIEAEQHGVQLMEGQATRDPTTFSNEQNSTNPAIMMRRQVQEQQMTDALDNIRQQAGPTTLQNNSIQNGQIAVDALKSYDQPIKADISAKYKALTDANGGIVPIDAGQFLTSTDSLLKKQYLTDSVPPAAKQLLNSLRAGEPLDFEGFEAARTRLAEAQRNGGSEAAAAGLIRNQLEQIPLSPAASGLKDLANTARSAARARFDELDADPAYQAAVDDTAKIGAPSPLADKFLDKYALGAPKANLDLMIQKLDPEAQQAIASHTLSTIRDSAITPNGAVTPNGFNRAMQKFGPKLDSLVQPNTVDSLESLGRVITNAKVPPVGNFVNYSKSGVLRNAATDTSNVVKDTATELGSAALNAKTFGMGVPIIRNIADRSFAKRVLAPGAGVQKLSDLMNPGTNP